jgi:hypothetical protein
MLKKLLITLNINQFYSFSLISLQLEANFNSRIENQTIPQYFSQLQVRLFTQIPPLPLPK